MGYRLAELEDTLLGRIKEQLPYLATVETYAGQIEAVQEELKIRGVRFPAVLVLFQEDSGKLQSKSSYETALTFRLLAICRNLRSEQEARREDFGAYQILDDLKKAFVNQKLGLKIDPIEYPKTQLISMSQDQVIYGMDYILTCYWP